MEERMMHLLSLIAGQVQTRQDLFSDEGRIMDALTSRGFRLQEADAALMLMQTLAQDGVSASGGMRAMSREERRRFSVEAFGLVTKLAVLGIISEGQREDIIENALSFRQDRIGLDEVKTLLALNLFGDTRDTEEHLSPTGDRRGAVWN